MSSDFFGAPYGVSIVVDGTKYNYCLDTHERIRGLFTDSSALGFVTEFTVVTRSGRPDSRQLEAHEVADILKASAMSDSTSQDTASTGVCL
jgi:hypothetical protein